MSLRGRPIGRGVSASVGTTGEAFDLRPITRTGHHTRQVEVSVDGLAFVGVGPSATPPTPTTTNTSYQEADTTMLYTLDGNRNVESYFYVYATTGTITARVSMFA